MRNKKTTGDSRLERRATFHARMTEIHQATDFVIDAVRDAGLELDDAILFDIRLAVTEAFSNIVEHSYRNDPEQTLEIELAVADGRLTLELTDRGLRPDPHRLHSRKLNEYRERGLGLFLMSQCMDGVLFRFTGDGRNHLQLTRSLAPGSREPRGESRHFPFHVAVYAREGEIALYLVGSFDLTRHDPLPGIPLDGCLRLRLDLASLEFIDARGVRSLEDLVARAARGGVAVKLIRPEAAVTAALAASGLASLLADSLPPEQAPPAPPTAGAPRGHFLPLTRNCGEQFFSASTAMSADELDAYRAFMLRLVPPLKEQDGVRLESGLRWGAQPHGLFFRLLAPPGRPPLLFLGAYADRGWPAVVATTELYATLGQVADLPGTNGLHGFLSGLSSLMRDLLPTLTSSVESSGLQLLVVELDPAGARAWTGNGPLLAHVGDLALSAMLIGSSESSPLQVVDVPAEAWRTEAERRRLRFFLGSLDADERARLATAPPAVCAALAGAGDKGVLDVSMPRR